MPDNQLLKMTITELAPLIRAGKVSPVELTEAALAKAERLLPELHSWITFLPEQARAKAKQREQAIRRGEYLGPLDGVPIGIKDNMATAGIRTTVGSKVLANNVPDEDSFVVERCKRAGAVIIGKENLEEFASGVRSANPHYGEVRNPWNPGHVPGGSSGGSAANVASCITFASLGTDAGGSVRIPAAFCGVVGMKQTYGRVSQRGLLMTSFAGDHIGPLTRSVADNALMLQVIAGQDPLDPSTVPVPVPDFSRELGRSLTGLKIGIPVNHYFDIIDPDVDAAVRTAIATLQEMGAEAVEVRLDTLQYLDLVGAAGGADSFLLHEPYLTDHRDEYTPEQLYRILSGQFGLARDYAKAMRVQRLVMEDFARVLQRVDLLVTPTVPIPALPCGNGSITVGGIEYAANVVGRTGATSLAVRNTFPSNRTGLPSLSVPCGFTRAGLPIGLQFIGSPFEEALLYGVASRYEDVSPSKGKLPAIA